jgi:hypothetical protein
MMQSKKLLVVSAVFETTTGLALIAVPAMLVEILLGASLDTPVAMVVARIAGAALLSLGVACWLMQDERAGRAIRALLAAMLIYNVAAVAVLLHGKLLLNLNGIGIWPVIGAHTALAAWCIACWRHAD